jgi:cellulose synthase operon protein C
LNNQDQRTIVFFEMVVIVLCLLLGGAIPASAAPSEAQLYSEAESRYLGKNYAAALEAYDGLLREFPLSERAPDVRYRRAVCLYRLERWQESAVALDEISRKHRSTRYIGYVPFWKGLALYHLQSWSLCISSLDEFLAGEKDPELTPQAMLHRSLALDALGQGPQARRSLADLLDAFPSSSVVPTAAVTLGSLLQKEGLVGDLAALASRYDPGTFPAPWADRFLLLQAEAHLANGREPEAEALYRRLTGAGEDVALVAYRRLFSAAQGRSDLQQMQGLTQAAEERFAGRTAVLVELWTRAGAESFRQGRREAAELFLQKAWNQRAKQPVNEVVPLYLSEIALARGDRAAARSLLGQYVQEGDIGTGATVIRLGDIALLAGDYAGAAEQYERFRGAFPGSKRAAEVEYLLAYCALRQGRTDDAMRLAESSLRMPAGDDIRQQALKLRIVLLKRGRRTGEAAAGLEEYIRQFPDDLGSRLDLLRAAFTLKQYDRVVAEADAARARFPAMEKGDPSAFLVVSYFRGLSLVARKDYRGAITELRAVQTPAAQAAGLAGITPYARYYLGWAYLRTAAFDRAAAVFDELAAGWPGHELSPMVLYLAGWSHYSMENWQRAAGYFASLSKGTAPAELRQKGIYLYAKSLLAAGRKPEAVDAFMGIVESSPPSPYADDALFDAAAAMDSMDQARQSAETYRRLAERFRDSPLREEALYRRAEVSFSHGLFPDAKAGFTDYRREYPSGKLVDAALFWGGSAALAAGEGVGAALFWEQLIAQHGTSAFRPSAMQKTAEVYAGAGNLPKALDLYARFLSEYPDEARTAKADIRAEQLRYQALGLSEREAELSTRISRETGAARREARLELARLYILSGESKAETGRQLLQQVIRDGEPESSAKAQSLLGEYAYRQGDLEGASRQFLAAAVTASAPQLGERGAELAASSIYRAAEMMKLAGKPDEVAALAKRLADRFPSSPWTAKARSLTGGTP